MKDRLDIVNGGDRHAFMILGADTFFICHLTMVWMENHRYQVILEINLPDLIRKQYLEDSKGHSEPYFIANRKDCLMSNPDIARGAVKSFQATIWRGIPDSFSGWPWEKWPVFADDVTVDISRVVYYRHFDFQLNDPKTLTYVLFGKGKEAHLQNFQVAELDFDRSQVPIPKITKPTYDHILSLSEAPTWLPDPQLQAGVHINFPGLKARPDNGSVYCADPLHEDHYQVQYCGHNKPLFDISLADRRWFGTAIVNLGQDPCRQGSEAG